MAEKKRSRLALGVDRGATSTRLMLINGSGAVLFLKARARLAPARLAFTTLKRPAEYAAARLALERLYGRT